LLSSPLILFFNQYVLKYILRHSNGFFIFFVASEKQHTCKLHRLLGK